MARAVVLLSGGLDSYTAAAAARREDVELCALTFQYGQRHAVELDAARRVAAALGISRHLVMDLDLSAIGGSALTTAGAEIPKDGADTGEIPVTYVPGRNTIFLAVAMGWAESLDASQIIIGVNAVDYSGYPDCRPEFIHAFEQLARVATRAGVEGHPMAIRAPLLHLSKAEIIRLGVELGLDYGLSRSCYDPDASGAPRGRCDSCRLRAAGFAAAGVVDPLGSSAGSR